MKLSSHLRRTIGVLASLTLVTGAIAIGSPAAQAAGTLTGPSSANPSQQVTFTLPNPPAGNLVLEDTNGQGYAYQSCRARRPQRALHISSRRANAQTLNLFVADQDSGAANLQHGHSQRRWRCCHHDSYRRSQHSDPG